MSDDLDVEALELVERLLQQCRERGLHVGPSLEVDAATAAELCARSPQTLANLRSLGRGAEFSRRSNRVRYTLTSLADWMLLTLDE